MSQRPGSIVFGLVVGLGIAVLSYEWISSPDRGAERREQERVVAESRSLLKETLAIEQLEIVDPLSPQRRVGKVYIYPQQAGWELSGYYRRDESDIWHPYLLSMEVDLSLESLRVKDKDPALERIAAEDKRLSINP